MSDMNELISKFIELREKKQVLESSIKEEVDQISMLMEKLKVALGKKLAETGAESLKTSSGTVYTHVDERASCGDWAAFYKFVVDSNRPDMLSRTVNKAAIKEFLEDTEGLPPGIKMDTNVSVRVKTAAKK